MEFEKLATGNWNNRWWLLAALSQVFRVSVCHNTNIAHTHQRSCPHLSLSPSLPLSLSLRISLAPLYLSTYPFLLPPSPPLLPSTALFLLSPLTRSLPPSLIFSPLWLSLHLALSLSWMWVVMTFVVTFQNILIHALIDIFLGAAPPSPPPPPPDAKGCYCRPTSALAVQFDVLSLHSGVSLPFAQTRIACVRSFWIDRLRLLGTNSVLRLLLSYLCGGHQSTPVSVKLDNSGSQLCLYFTLHYSHTLTVFISHTI